MLYAGDPDRKAQTVALPPLHSRVELDDQLFLNRCGNVLSVRTLYDSPVEIRLVNSQPGNQLPGPTKRLVYDVQLPAALCHLDQVTRFRQVGGHVHPLSVDREMIVANELSTGFS